MCVCNCTEYGVLHTNVNLWCVVLYYSLSPVFLQAFYLRLPTGYVWITYGWYFNKFWEDPVSFGFSRNCTIEELGNIVEEMLFISTNSSNQDNMCKDIVGLVNYMCSFVIPLSEMFACDTHIDCMQMYCTYVHM